MKIRNLLLGLKRNGFKASLIVDAKEIRDKFKVLNEHDYLLVVSNDALNNANAEIAYGFNITDKGASVCHYNKHCIRPELGRVYTTNYADEEKMTSSIITNVTTLSRSLIALSESTKK